MEFIFAFVGIRGRVAVMMRLRWFPFLLFLVLSKAGAQTTAFEFLSFDRTKNEGIDCEMIYGVEVTTFDFQGPRFHFHSTTSVDGLKQERVTFTTEQFSGNLPREEWEKFLSDVRKLPLKPLTEGKKENTRGHVILDGKEYPLIAGLGTEARKAWQKFLDEFVHRFPSDYSTGRTTSTLEGESVKPLEVTVDEVIRDPGKFEGKRIRVTAFYHTEFECSHFVQRAADSNDIRKGIWFTSVSSFAKPGEFELENDHRVVVEGTFSSRPGSRGHMGAWVGGLILVTSIKSSPAP
ncbi:hypothetical protein [Luteolibacter marinus]|uniref:hypothetical protein n=1 Tax=Luteolibacter marinus TaxID=2776705 RepID=UPI0018687B46|nr:hypothetical protein [Luteolibacter marinus]